MKRETRKLKKPRTEQKNKINNDMSLVKLIADFIANQKLNKLKRLISKDPDMLQTLEKLKKAYDDAEQTYSEFCKKYPEHNLCKNREEG